MASVGRIVLLPRFSPRAARSAEKSLQFPPLNNVLVRSMSSSLSRLPNSPPIFDRREHDDRRANPPAANDNWGRRSPLRRPDAKQPRHFSSSSSGGDQDPPSATVEVSIEDALDVTKRALAKIGWDDDDAKLQAEIMVSAELCGNNQGLVPAGSHAAGPQQRQARGGARRPDVGRHQRAPSPWHAGGGPRRRPGRRQGPAGLDNCHCHVVQHQHQLGTARVLRGPDGPPGRRGRGGNRPGQLARVRGRRPRREARVRDQPPRRRRPRGRFRHALHGT
jgi:hypothetical protein